MNILIYTDFPVISVGLEHILRRLECKLIVKSYEFSHLISLLSGTSATFDVLIIDSGGDDWRTLQRIGIIRQVYQRKPLRVLALVEGEKRAQLHIAAGIEAVVKKQAGIPELAEAIGAVLLRKPHHGHKPAQPQAADYGYNWGSGIRFVTVELLSERENQIIDLLMKGVSQREISRKLTLHSATIATYKKRAFDKLGVRSIGELHALFRGCTF